MDLPLCKICGDRHRLGGCPKFLGPVAAQRRNWLKAMTGPARAEPVETVTPPPLAPDIKEIADAPETAGAPQADQHHQAQEAAEAPPQVKKFDKVAYQRELMRKRRAAAKASACGSTS